MSGSIAPKPVQIAFSLWMLAIATALAEVITRLVVDSRGPLEALLNSGEELSLRFGAFILLAILATLMLRGANLARHLLTLLFGILGTISLVMEPLSWLVTGGDVGHFIVHAEPAVWVIISARLVHVLAVLGAVYCSYRADAAPYFARRRPLAAE